MNAFLMVTAVIATAIATTTTIFNVWIEEKGRRLHTAVVCFTICLSIYFVLNVFSSMIYLNAPTRAARFTEAQEASGFTSGYEYPLVLGDRGSASYSKEEVYHGLFYFRMTRQSVSGSSVLVSYQHADGLVEIIEIPISIINFHVVNNSEDTSLVIDLGAINAPAEGYTIENSCNLEVAWGWWVHDCGAPTTLIAPTNSEGVAGLLQRAFSTSPGKIVTMTVTQEQFNHILGAMESS